jgi:hypothetical protein
MDMCFRRAFGFTTLTILLAVGVLLAPSGATAAGPQGNSFGLGLSLGNPTSITGKYYLSDVNYADFHLGAYQTYNRRYYEESLFLAGDYVWQVYNFHEDTTISIPFYIGVGGGLIVDANDDYDCDIVRNGECFDLDRGDYFQAAIGPRMPVGAAFQFQNAPFELFVEFSPSLYFVFYEDGYRDDMRIAFEVFNFAIGGRFYFGG